MPGLSLSVPPSSNLSPTLRKPPPTTTNLQQQQQHKATGSEMDSLRAIELQLVAFIMVFSASGLVPVRDLMFPFFASLYIILLSRFAFPSKPSSSSDSNEIFHGSAWYRAYVVLGTTVGLFFPLVYVLSGFARGDVHAVKSATSQLFLLTCQILTEDLVGRMSMFSPPVRALVPLIYTGKRIFVIVDWVYDVWSSRALSATVGFQDVAWVWFGKVLALANLAYFSINLFAFLIPLILPRAFESYIRIQDEVPSKMVEDKRRAAPVSEDETQKSKKAS